MLFYFTATGNSLSVAKEIEAQPVSIAQAIHDEDKVYRAGSIGIVCPVFGYEMPELMKEFLKASRFETDYFYILLTYGNRHGGAAELAKEYVECLGIHPAYINVVLMADNFLPGFDMEEQKRLDKKVDEQLGRIKADLAQKNSGSPLSLGRTGLPTRSFLPGFPMRRICSTISIRSRMSVSAVESVRRSVRKNVFTWRGRRASGTGRAVSPAWPVSIPAPCWPSS